MPQLTSNARKALDQIRADLADIREARELAYAEALDQVLVRMLLSRMADYEARLERRLREEIEPLLERQAPQYERRLAQLEAQVKALLEQPHLVSRPGQRRAEGG